MMLLKPRWDHFGTVLRPMNIENGHLYFASQNKGLVPHFVNEMGCRTQRPFLIVSWARLADESYKAEHLYFAKQNKGLVSHFVNEMGYRTKGAHFECSSV